MQAWCGAFDTVCPPSSRDAAAQLVGVLHSARSSEGVPDLSAEGRQKTEEMITHLELLQQLTSHTSNLMAEAEVRA